MSPTITARNKKAQPVKFSPDTKNQPSVSPTRIIRPKKNKSKSPLKRTKKSPIKRTDIGELDEEINAMDKNTRGSPIKLETEPQQAFFRGNVKLVQKKKKKIQMQEYEPEQASSGLKKLSPKKKTYFIQKKIFIDEKGTEIKGEIQEIQSRKNSTVIRHESRQNLPAYVRQKNINRRQPSERNIFGQMRKSSKNLNLQKQKSIRFKLKDLETPLKTLVEIQNSPEYDGNTKTMEECFGGRMNIVTSRKNTVDDMVKISNNLQTDKDLHVNTSMSFRMYKITEASIDNSTQGHGGRGVASNAEEQFGSSQYDPSPQPQVSQRLNFMKQQSIYGRRREEQTRVQAQKNEDIAIKNFLERSIDFNKSSNKGRIIFEKQRGPIENEKEGGFVTRSMIGDTRMHEDGKMIQDYNIKHRAMEKRLKKFGGYKNSQLRKESKISQFIHHNSQMMAFGELPSQLDNNSEVSSNSNNFKIGGFTDLKFGFKEKKKTKLEDENSKHMTDKEFELLCYDAYKRVQENQAIQQKNENAILIEKPKKLLNLEELSGIQYANELRRRLLTPNENVKKRVELDPFQNPSLIIEKKIERSIMSPVEKVRQPLSLSMKLQETQQDRRLNKYAEYLKKWDKYENQIHNHFDYKDIKMYGSTEVVENIKRAKEAKKVPKIKNISNLIQNQKVGKVTEGFSKNLKIVSLANSIKDRQSYMASQLSPTSGRQCNVNGTIDLLHSVGSSIDSEDLDFSLFKNNQSIESPQTQIHNQKMKNKKTGHKFNVQKEEQITEDEEWSTIMKDGALMEGLDDKNQDIFKKQFKLQQQQNTARRQQDSKENSLYEEDDQTNFSLPDGITSPLDTGRNTTQYTSSADRNQNIAEIQQKISMNIQEDGHILSTDRQDSLITDRLFFPMSSQSPRMNQTVIESYRQRQNKPRQVLDMFEESKDCSKVLGQLNQRQSIINQGDVYIQRKNQKEALRMASFDNNKILPQQIWYDSLRSSDDGSFSKTTITNKLQSSDPIDYIKSSRKQDVEKTRLKNKILDKWAKLNTIHTRIKDNNMKFQDRGKNSHLIPFNSRSRNAYTVIKNGSYFTCPTLQKIDVVGNSDKSGDQKAIEKMRDMKNKNVDEIINLKLLDQPLDINEGCLIPMFQTTAQIQNQSIDTFGGLTTGRTSVSNERVVKSINILKNGLTKNINNLQKFNNARYQKIMDQITDNFPQDAPVFGKPNVLINPQAVVFGEYINIALRKFTPQELIKLAQSYSINRSSSQIMKKIFEEIEREKNQNEYNRTQIHDRAADLKDTANRLQFNINQAHGLRLIEKTDTSIRKESYINKMARTNQEHLKRVTNNTLGGNMDPLASATNDNLVYLQIKGQNQLIKEIEEIQNIEEKILYTAAIHKNEITQEIEGHYNLNAEHQHVLSCSSMEKSKNEELTETLSEINAMEPPSPSPGASSPYKAAMDQNSMNSNISKAYIEKKNKITKRVPLQIDYEAIKLKQIDEIIEQQHDNKDFFV